MADVTTQKIDYRSTSLPEYLDKPYQEYMGLYGGQVAADLKTGAPDFGKDRIAGLRRSSRKRDESLRWKWHQRRSLRLLQA
jgi:hypothetical protein